MRFADTFGGECCRGETLFVLVVDSEFAGILTSDRPEEFVDIGIERMLSTGEDVDDLALIE